MNNTTRYTLRFRPPSFATLPCGINWTLVARPSGCVGFERRTDLPISEYSFGEITFDRALTADEIESFELKAL